MSSRRSSAGATAPGYSAADSAVLSAERARRVRMTRSDWLSSVEDIQFCHEALGVEAIPFSGDLRPRAARAMQRDRACGGYDRSA